MPRASAPRSSRAQLIGEERPPQARWASSAVDQPSSDTLLRAAMADGDVSVWRRVHVMHVGVQALCTTLMGTATVAARHDTRRLGAAHPPGGLRWPRGTAGGRRVRAGSRPAARFPKAALSSRACSSRVNPGSSVDEQRGQRESERYHTVDMSCSGSRCGADPGLHGSFSQTPCAGRAASRKGA